jgi:hypothetical protein
MPIEPLSPATRDYLRKLGMVAVAVSMADRVYVTTDPTGCKAAFWCERDAAGRLAQAAWKSADVPTTARLLRISVVPHPIMLSRVAREKVK